MGNRTDLRRKVKNPLTNNVVLILAVISSIWVNVYSVTTVENTCEGVTSIVNVEVCVECRGVVKKTCVVSADATSAEQRIMLPFPLRVLCAIWFASLSIWKISPLNFSTDHLPLESTSRSNTPAFAVLRVAPCSAIL